jgi:hypothetical protein
MENVREYAVLKAVAIQSLSRAYFPFQDGEEYMGSGQLYPLVRAV